VALSDRAIHVILFDMAFAGMLAYYDASFGGPGNVVAQILTQLSKPPPVAFTSSAINPFQILVGFAAFAQWFAVELGTLLLLFFVIVPLTTVPGVPYANFLFTAFQIILVIWGWALVKPSGGTPG